MKSSELAGCKIVALAPHTDDYELGAGATLYKWIKQGAKVYGIALSDCWKYVPKPFPPHSTVKEFTNAGAVLGIDNFEIENYPVDEFPANRQDICQLFWGINHELAPEIVLCPCSEDVHQDHHVVYEEARRTFKHSSILGYEMPWNCFVMPGNYFSIVDKKAVAVKISALRQYESQGHKPVMDADYLESWLKTRGQQVGAAYAECFEVIRMVDK